MLCQVTKLRDHIIIYLASSSEKIITFGKKSEYNFIRYSDSDWVGDYSNRKSTSRFVFTFNKRTISYNSKKQVVIALSSTKTKYMALSLAAQKAI